LRGGAGILLPMTTTVRLFDTQTRSAREFAPRHGDEVGLYSCGPTVYDYAHIGNLRTYLFVDVLRRTLGFAGYRVKHVMNITDVGHLTSDADTGEDKIEAGSRRVGKSAWEIAEQFTEAFRDDLRRLNILDPVIWCKATDHIPEQIAFIQCIEAKGFAYRTSDGIYFDTSRLDDYGYLARLDVAGLRAGARVDQGERRALEVQSAGSSGRWSRSLGRRVSSWHRCSRRVGRSTWTFFDIHTRRRGSSPIPPADRQTGLRYPPRRFWMPAFLQLDVESRSAGS
jgi:cysteinyl-tRNA synthetase